MNKIPVICKTNLDNYDTTYISDLLIPPVKGDYVEVIYKGQKSKLKIVSITHRLQYIELELHN